MANYYGYGRSNYFKVKDMDAFIAFTEKFNGSIEIAINDTCPNAEYREKLKNLTSDDAICLLSNDECGDLPGWVYNEETDDDEEIDIFKAIAEHLQEEKDNLFIWQHVGHEKLRYVSGYAMAMDYTGDIIDLGLRSIYDLAADHFDVTEISKCEY
jgi:hypothetical protein